MPVSYRYAGSKPRGNILTIDNKGTRMQGMRTRGNGAGGDGWDDRLPLRIVAARYGRKPQTMRRWYSDPEANERFNASALLRRDQSGRLYSTPRLMSEWESYWNNN